VAAAIVVTEAAAIVVTEAAAKAGTTVVTVEPVRVAAPPRVPKVTGAPLRERPGLGLGDGSRPQTCEPQACNHDECRHCNARNVFHTQSVPLTPPNLWRVRTLDIVLQRQSDVS
jgi:hypothetical protein